ncbi:MAG: transposase [Candidatus Acidiferrales bacterium]
MIVSQHELIVSRDSEIEQLKWLIAKLRRMQFGRSSEKLDRQIEQLELRLEALQMNDAETVPAVRQIVDHQDASRPRATRALEPLVKAVAIDDQEIASAGDGGVESGSGVGGFVDRDHLDTASPQRRHRIRRVHRRCEMHRPAVLQQRFGENQTSPNMAAANRYRCIGTENGGQSPWQISTCMRGCFKLIYRRLCIGKTAALRLP